jgi:pyocin large subunit-like protein
MVGTKRAVLAGLLALAGAGLWACDKGSSAPARNHAEEGAPSSRSYDAPRSGGDGYADRSDGGYARREEARPPTPLVDGVPMWSDNRRHTAEENAEYHFHRDGPDFGASSVKDYVAKAHHFIEHPPGSVETVSRSNGDKLLYDAKTNTFAVERKDGAPRTMFKPHDGVAYWKEQQAKAAAGDDSYGGRRSRRSDDGGEG